MTLEDPGYVRGAGRERYSVMQVSEAGRLRVREGKPLHCKAVCRFFVKALSKSDASNLSLRLSCHTMCMPLAVGIHHQTQPRGSLGP